MIVIQRNGTTETYTPSEYMNEEELERVICANPQLLVRGEGSPLHFVARQVGLPAGTMDVLLLSEDGLPVAVEVKLGRNAQARREIVGQLIDYVSVLTSYTVDELNDAVAGNLEATISQMAGDDASHKKIWQTVGVNLRAGMARYILALDRAPEELERIVSFLARRSNLDIRLVIISKYIASDGMTVLTPLNVIDESESGVLALEPSHSRTPGAEFQAVIDAYNEMEAPPLALQGRACNYRRLRHECWPVGLHYQFQAENDGTVKVGIHLDNDNVLCLIGLFEGWMNDPERPNLISAGGRRRGTYRFLSALQNGNPAEIADAMRRLIEATMDDITAELRKHKVIPGR